MHYIKLLLSILVLIFMVYSMYCDMDATVTCVILVIWVIEVIRVRVAWH